MHGGDAKHLARATGIEHVADVADDGGIPIGAELRAMRPRERGPAQRTDRYREGDACTGERDPGPAHAVERSPELGPVGARNDDHHERRADGKADRQALRAEASLHRRSSAMNANNASSSQCRIRFVLNDAPRGSIPACLITLRTG
jgi:hypothetical protein